MTMHYEDLNNMFTYHAPFGDQAERYQHIRDVGRRFAEVILSNTPVCGEQTLAVRKIQEAVMMANAAIALHEVNTDAV